MLMRSPISAAPRSIATGSMLSRGASLAPLKLRVKVRLLPLMRKGMRAVADTLPVSGGVNVACSCNFNRLGCLKRSLLQGFAQMLNIPYWGGEPAAKM